MKLKYTMFLQNVDDSITQLKLKHDFQIVSLNEPDSFEFIKKLEKCSISEAVRKIGIDSHVFNYDTRKIYLIEREFNLKNQEIEESSKIAGKFHQEIGMQYLELLITALRLFNEGDLAYWNSYFYDPNKTSTFQSISNNLQSRTILSKKYSFFPDEIEQCNTFINDFVTPKSDFLKLAIEHFNNSYFAVSLESAFLSLMISLEALYTKETRELSFRLARNCAILLGTNCENAQIIFDDMKKLYDKRSKLVHGSSNKITQEDVYKCRDFVRCSIKKFIILKEKHDEFLNKLDTLGFGQPIEG